MRKYLRKLRKDAGLTQAVVAMKLNMGHSTYAMIESGERQKDLNLSLAKKLGEIFNISVEKIIEEEEKLKNKLEKGV